LTKRVGLPFGHFFHKLIWSPCRTTSLERKRVESSRIELIPPHLSVFAGRVKGDPIGPDFAFWANFIFEGVRARARLGKQPRIFWVFIYFLFTLVTLSHSGSSCANVYFGHFLKLQKFMTQFLGYFFGLLFWATFLGLLFGGYFWATFLATYFSEENAWMHFVRIDGYILGDFITKSSGHTEQLRICEILWPLPQVRCPVSSEPAGGGCAMSSTGILPLLWMYNYLFKYFCGQCLYTQTMHIKPFNTQQHFYVSLKTLYPVGIWTRVFSFLRQMRCPLRHAARTLQLQLPIICMYWCCSIG
jgi:hypothetical protein